MKILHIIDSLGAGGAEKLIVDTVPLLVERSNEVDVLLLNGEKTPFYAELEEKNCCNIYSLGRSFYNPFYILKIIPYLFKYNVVHVHLFPAQYFAALARIFCWKKQKFIFTEHNTSNRRLKNNKLKTLERFIYSFYDKIICITPEVKEVLINKLAIKENKLIVIENGVDIAKINNAKPHNKETFRFKETDILLMMVAGFREQKDHDTLIKTLSSLPEKYKLILVGGGEREDKLKQLVEALGLQNRVHFLGIRSDVYSLYKMSNIAVLSSHYEGFGIAAVEAMACGIPLVASDVEGLAQVVSGGGIVFEKGNTDALKERILSLENEAYYKEIAFKGKVKAQQYDIKKLVDRTIDIYCN
ncbi:putative lipopolysaccharide biosynthesis protein [Chryseobacterium sp. StRB126]|uniref:glycosyltransferase n=1 Tax=Chryseobacterium sp. StRB126 TaxID=878220 RepID=UPI0004E996D1|nr:glycosyltransferase [Chryseobacterium sp. StRB126]BAP33035.1 putative lipopolysaccharide biosynthesis protein [Chryseobacterium sp. StRB126]